MELSFGKAVDEQRIVDNVWQKRFQGQYILHLICPWRIDCPINGPICSSSCNDDEIRQKANCLLGEVIKDIELILPFGDATFYFQSEKILKCFCTCNGEGSSWDCCDWVFCDLESEYQVYRWEEVVQFERSRILSDTLYDPDEIDWQYVSSDKDYVREADRLPYAECF